MTSRDDATPDAALLSQVRRLLAQAGSSTDGSNDAGQTSDLERLCRAVAAYLGIEGAAVTLMGEDVGDGVAAATDDRARRLAALTFAAGEGPCRDAFDTGRPLLVADLEAAGVRWPGYLSLAVESGLGAVLVFPLQVGAARFGVLSLFHGKPRSVTADELAVVYAFVRLATETLVDLLRAGPRQRTGSGLMDALDYRSEVYQAQGMVMVQLDVGLEEALARMRAYAFGHAMTLSDLAHEILSGREFTEDEM